MYKPSDPDSVFTQLRYDIREAQPLIRLGWWRILHVARCDPDRRVNLTEIKQRPTFSGITERKHAQLRSDMNRLIQAGMFKRVQRSVYQLAVPDWVADETLRMLGCGLRPFYREIFDLPPCVQANDPRFYDCTTGRALFNTGTTTTPPPQGMNGGRLYGE